MLSANLVSLRSVSDSSVERIFEHGGHGVFSKPLGKGARGSVSGDLVVLDLLCDANDECIADRIVGIQLKRALALFDEPLHRLALLASSRSVELFQGFFESLDVSFGLLEMFFESFRELLVGGRLGHLGERLGELNFSAVEILQLMNECIMERSYFHTGCLSFADLWAAPR